MKERAIDHERTVVTDDQAAKVPQPSEGALHGPAPFVASQRPAILPRRVATAKAVRRDQQDAPLWQPCSQRITVVALVGNHAQRFLPWTSGAMLATYADRRERSLREPDFRRGRRTKVVPQRNSAAVDHHHPLRAIAPLGFSDFRAP